MGIDSPTVCRKGYVRNEVREGTPEDGRVRRWQVQKFVVESRWGLWPIIEKR